MNAPQRVVPFFFGDQGRALFGCFHEPARKCLRRSAVLICQPVGHEYINSHRALRQLAVRLAEAGFPVLRFDYYGCGDSSGEADEGSIAQWLDDISTAIAELRRRAASCPVYVVGLRLGGTLATIGGANCNDVAGLVLWDPVVNGSDYFQELLALQKEMLRFRLKPRKNTRGHIEILGFPIPNTLRTELENLDLAIPEKPAQRVLVVQTGEAANGLKHQLLCTRAQVEHQKVGASKIWLPTPDGSLLVPAPVLQAVVSWICGVAS